MNQPLPINMGGSLVLVEIHHFWWGTPQYKSTGVYFFWVNMMCENHTHFIPSVHGAAKNGIVSRRSKAKRTRTTRNPDGSRREPRGKPKPRKPCEYGFETKGFVRYWSKQGDMTPGKCRVRENPLARQNSVRRFSSAFVSSIFMVLGGAVRCSSRASMRMFAQARTTSMRGDVSELQKESTRNLWMHAMVQRSVPFCLGTDRDGHPGSEDERPEAFLFKEP